ncbi:hypothetical protein PsAD46_01343 [Pseudovibrio sp. Ad46]|nr:hypothetical protein PsAD46_01343 [Pseudovibrio sp. Ad46]KZK98909.1 hypothetical protein PsAD5_01532 [Pseudovibrio sp. Ad5]
MAITRQDIDQKIIATSFQGDVFKLNTISKAYYVSGNFCLRGGK